MSERFKQIAFRILAVVGALVFVLIVSVATDRIYGRLFAAPDSYSLLYPPHMVADYETNEFKFTVKTNAYGLRGPDFDAQKRHAIRVLALGDSFTFGWGVNAEETWIRRLEHQLRAEGLDIEILNLGAPGASPPLYSRYLSHAIHVLKPDYVLINLLQGDDIEQTYARGDKLDEFDLSGKARTWSRILFPNFSGLSQARRDRLQQHSKGLWVLITPEWKSMAQEIFEGFDGEERERFERLDPNLRQDFLAGRMNPILIRHLVDSNDGIGKTLLGIDADTRLRYAEKTAEYLTRIRRMCEKHDAIAIAISVPSGIYNSPEIHATRLELGAALPPEALETNVADETAQLACDLAAIPLITVSDAFREVALQRPLFYPIDTHFNAEGNRAFADVLAPALRSYLD